MQHDGAVLDRSAIAAWMDGRGLGEGPLSSFEPLTGGTQNVMVSFTRAGRRYVLRRGPEHLRPRSNRNILREITLLGALAGTDVPHARLIAASADPDVLHGAVFYLMEPVDGFNALVELPPSWRRDAETRRRAGYALVEALATLGAVDHAQVGLGGFGKPENFLERQVDRWMGELETYSALPGYGGPQIEGIDRVASWLSDNRPDRSSPGILHGDYHVANVMFTRERPEVAAIIDWEMSTIGDPLLDVGLVLAFWGDDRLEPPAMPRIQGFSRGAGAPSRGALAERYAQRSGRSVDHLAYYMALAFWKLAAIVEGAHMHFTTGALRTDHARELEQDVPRLLAEARAFTAQAG
jgi:aminoglycoside phosphotransferase (APT) family kinase protein